VGFTETDGEHVRPARHPNAVDGGGAAGHRPSSASSAAAEADVSAAAGSVALPPNVQAGQLMLLFITAVNAGTALTMSAAPSRLDAPAGRLE
jgi:hypothetical protein